MQPQVLLGADINLDAISLNADEAKNGDVVSRSDAGNPCMPDLYVECHLNGELLGHSSMICGSTSPRWIPPQTIPLSSLRIQHGATNQLVLCLCDYYRCSDQQGDPSALGIVGSVDVRGIGAAALPTKPTHLPLVTKTSSGSTMQVGTIEVCTGRRRRDVNLRAAEAGWTAAQLDAAVGSVRLSTRLRRQRVALAQALTTTQDAVRQAAAAQARADAAEATASTISQRLQNVTTAQEKEKEKQKELRQQLTVIEKSQQEAVAQAVAEAVHDVQTDASRANELGALQNIHPTKTYISHTLLRHVRSHTVVGYRSRVSHTSVPRPCNVYCWSILWR